MYVATHHAAYFSLLQCVCFVPACTCKGTPIGTGRISADRRCGRARDLLVGNTDAFVLLLAVAAMRDESREAGSAAVVDGLMPHTSRCGAICNLT